MKYFLSRLKKWMLKHLVVVFACLLYYHFLYLIDQTCLIKAVIGIDCPTCGCTRAILSLFRGDFYGYVKYNYLAVPLLIVFLVMIHGRAKSKKGFTVLAIFLCVALTIRYILTFI